MSAGRVLLDNSKSVLILEARDRPLGRIWSNTQLGFPIDLGASWIHGINDNPLHTLARENNVRFLRTDFLNVQANDLDSRRTFPSSLVLAEYGRFLLAKANVDRQTRNLTADVPLDTLWKKERSKWTLNVQQEKLWNLNVGTELELTLNADLKDLSAKNYDLEEVFDGNHVVFPDGYSTVFKKTMEGLNVSFSTVVNKMEMNDHYFVHTNKGVFESRKVIVSVPLGVLKTNLLTFSPPLPSFKAESIKKLGFGLMNKVVLHFSNSFSWPNYDLFMNAPLNATVKFPVIVNWKKYTGHHAMIVTTFGEYAEMMEKQSDEQIVSIVLNLIRAFEPKVPNPLSYLITRWKQDVFSRGSYTYMKVDSTIEDLHNMAKPVQGIHFAGESTHIKYFATVHGAYLSGIRAATEIITSLKK